MSYFSAAVKSSLGKIASSNEPGCAAGQAHCKRPLRGLSRGSAGPTLSPRVRPISTLRFVVALLVRHNREVTLAPAGPAGNRFYMRLHPMADSAFIVGEYEPGCVRALREHLPKGSVCVDVGANVGYFSILMSRGFVGKQGQTIAFEPMPETVEVLRENVEVNHLENVIVVAAAASDGSGSVEILSDATDRATKTASMVGYHVEGQAQKTVVRSIRLDDYFDGSMRLPSLIKIDVEGAELMALKGARETIAKANPILIVEIHGWGSPGSQEVLNLLSDFGYRARIVGIWTREAFCIATPPKQDLNIGAWPTRSSFLQRVRLRGWEEWNDSFNTSRADSESAVTACASFIPRIRARSGGDIRNPVANWGCCWMRGCAAIISGRRRDRRFIPESGWCFPILPLAGTDSIKA